MQYEAALQGKQPERDAIQLFIKNMASESTDPPSANIPSETYFRAYEILLFNSYYLRSCTKSGFF